MASISKILSSQTKAIFLCYYKVFFFIPVVATHKYGCNPDLKTIVKKLFVVMLKNMGQLSNIS
jgi:hypothetical protein